VCREGQALLLAVEKACATTGVSGRMPWASRGQIRHWEKKSKGIGETVATQKNGVLNQSAKIGGVEKKVLENASKERIKSPAQRRKIKWQSEGG